MNLYTNEMENTQDFLICKACGTQFSISDPSLLVSCRICDDPRQFVPPTGQSFTTLSSLKTAGYKNHWKLLDEKDDRFWCVWTEPKFGIGQRAILIKTDRGNVLWDCISFLDDETVEWVKGMGGLGAIVISHPHFYSTVSHFPRLDVLPGRLILLGNDLSISFAN
jgi:hypothetical protein